MSLLSNKHVVTALIVAPVLALLSYFIVDQLVKEQPQPALEGQAYPLVAKSNCRYTSGECDLVNTSFKSKLMVEKNNDSSTLVLESSHILDAVKVGFADATEDESFSKPFAMRARNNTGKQWGIKMPMEANETTKVMVVIMADGAHYYAETTMGFSEYKASYKTDFTNSNQAPE